MDKVKALKLAIQSMEKHRQKLAVDANLCDLYGADYPVAVRASEQRKEINQAIDVLRGMIDECKGLSK